MYQALYRSYRPRSFDDVVGQEHITKILKNQIDSNRLSHAYLFTGTRGTGKTSCAKILAKAVNCENPSDGNPCNKCASCLGIDSGGIMDVVELDAASNNGVDNVRALRDEAIFSPAQVKKRVYIVDEVHMLSNSAFNALLKILEEPPAHLMFILATTEQSKVPATILSRCQRHSFKRIDNTAIAERLLYVAKCEGFRLEQDAAELLARLAGGSMRDALSLLDQCSGSGVIDSGAVLSAMGLAGKHRTAELLGFITLGETENALSLFTELWHDGKDPTTLIGELCTLMRDVLMLKVAPKGGLKLLSGGFELSVIKDFAAKMTAEELISDVDAMQSALGAMRGAQNTKTVAELCLIGLCEAELGESSANLLRRVARLEQALEGGDSLKTTGEAKEKKADAPEISEAEPIAAEETTPDAESGSPVSEIMDKMAASLPVGTYNILTDPVQVSATLEPDALVLKINPGFAMNQINRPDVIKKLGDAALEVTGRPVAVRLEKLGDQGAPPARGLEELGKFGIVTFK